VRTIEYIGTEENFLNRTSMAWALRSTVDKWDLMKVKNFCKEKDIVNRITWQPTDWKKIVINPTSDRGLISKIYKELKKVDLRKPNIPIKK
jgi:phage-related protein